LICGYPGETEENFEELKDWVREIKFERLGVFTYSHEENTHAHKLNDNIPQKEKQSRANEIMKLQKKISLKHNKSLIGTTLKVLIDKKEGSNYIGRTEFDSPEVDNTVIINCESRLSGTKQSHDNEIIPPPDPLHEGVLYFRIGDFVNVKITGAKEYDLIAAVIPAESPVFLYGAKAGI